MITRLRSWLRAHQPVWCVACRYVMFRKNAKWALTTLGNVHPLCKNCYQELYHPYGGK